MIKRVAGLGVVLALALNQCSDTTAPPSGNLSLQLSNAGTNDRAMLLEVAGPDSSARIDTVQATTGSPYRVFAQRQTLARWRVIVTGNLANGVLVTITVPDASRTTSYSGTILDVADASFADLPPGLRSVTVTP